MTDRATEEFLEAAKAAPARHPAEMSLEEFRAGSEAYRPHAFEREEVAAVDDLTLSVNGVGSVAVRLYRPERERPLPLLVWAHGGAWMRMSVDLLDTQFRAIANRSGCAVAAVEYERAPEGKFPQAIEEVQGVARELKQGGADLGLDPARIAVGGESSGGNLAAAVALLDRERSEVGYRLQVLVVPVLDVGFATESWRELDGKYLLGTEGLRWSLEQYAPGVSPDEPLLSPLRAETLAGLPPAIVVTGGLDPLRDEGNAYAARLREEGVEVDLIEVPGMIHHAVVVPNLISKGKAMWLDVATAVGEALSGQGARAGS